MICSGFYCNCLRCGIYEADFSVTGQGVLRYVAECIVTGQGVVRFVADCRLTG